ncbi:putative ATP synthase mitochondrial F1 complex assembly factor 2-like [Ditylenchus destructor]|uniref:ATP synthase mitochondrial F1 complex assembly factor 2-like n=1 Tax=Ditylenchus destructor TaxID=166010 RepID=A0AAD4MG74_9BILA|nr:putative ATP synthase mitochondrial F1 complex assembly factor 2-like [Ditylenchus destructor]
MPLTGLSNAAIDRIRRIRPPSPRAWPSTAKRSALLSRRSSARASAAPAGGMGSASRLGAHPLRDQSVTTTGVMHRAQSPETVAKLADAVAALSPFQLAALSPLVTVTGSLIAALALLEGAATPEDIWSAANLDEDGRPSIGGRTTRP